VTGCLFPLSLVSLLLLALPARAELWVWERDFYVHEDVDPDYVREALAIANRSLQRQNDPEDVGCPVELRIREIIRYGPRTPGMVDRPGRLRSPSQSSAPGFYFHNGVGPAFALKHNQLASFWVFKGQRRTPEGARAVRSVNSQSWAISHEMGHLAGLNHILRPRRAEIDDPATPEDERNTSDAPCTLMSYDYGFPSPPKMGVKCKSGTRLEAWQCEAYKRGADRVER
jgi:hypothetical protein